MFVFYYWSLFQFKRTAHKATGRGIHSPFLYRFVTMVIHHPWSYYEFSNSKPSKELYFETLIFAIVNDYQPNLVWLIGDQVQSYQLLIANARSKTRLQAFDGDLTTLPSTEKVELLIVELNEKVLNPLFLVSLFKHTSENCILVLRNIYTSPEHTTFWNSIKNNSNIRVSIDLFDFGVLLLRPDITPIQLKIKQIH
jgi:hypothetical protein